MSDGNPYDGDAACPDCEVITFNDGGTFTTPCAACARSYQQIYQQINDQVYPNILEAQPDHPLLSMDGAEVGSNWNVEQPDNRPRERQPAWLDGAWDLGYDFLEMAHMEHVSESREEPTPNMHLGHNIFGTADPVENADHRATTASELYLQANLLPPHAVTHHSNTNPPYDTAAVAGQPQHNFVGIPFNPYTQGPSLWNSAGLSMALTFAPIFQPPFQELNTFTPNAASNYAFSSNTAAGTGSPDHGGIGAEAEEAEGDQTIASQPSVSGTEGSSTPHGMGRRGQQSARLHASGLCIWCRQPNPDLSKKGCPPCLRDRAARTAEYRQRLRARRAEEMAAMALAVQVEKNAESLDMDQEEGA